jgi:hypothetical protein
MPDPRALKNLEHWLRDHHDIVAIPTLIALGLSRDYARVQVDARRWQRVHRGVYCAYTGPLTFESRCAAAIAACGETAVLTGATALTIYGLPGRDDGIVHVVVDHSAAAPALSGICVTRSTTLTDRSRVIRRGLPVTKIDRSLVDYSLRSPARAEGVLTEGVQRGFTTPVRLRACIFAMGHIPRRRLLLHITHQIEGGDRSAMERRFMRLVAKAGLPKPVQNHPLVINGRRLWLDACYPGLRIAIEIDGRAYHLFAEDWENDLARQNLLMLDGWLVLRFTSRAIRDRPDEVVAQIREAIAGRRAIPVADAG